ncbi:ABC transporter ATP-binding protein [Leuconostoc citreum]|jgi:branched-chain amino acid transport system ATP-binding protein|uniref:ABC transporter ATP-binding protein n=2 Tax=Bacteria TaxID=2 RepID=A0A5A5U0J5_LEUCI|nr:MULTISPECIES: ABC transporter ATP-binding protein [Leuconostoc]KAF0261551.1 ABC transporter ATP-binding protein [Leuconostoc citreum]MBA5937388.1 ABC transporter ATP-binding protein [Leuconostoc citreum]MBE4725856.1 ABC transporter ATP-binding protein [Leuconostoc citreum]MBU7450488.1 ABC transporter ATP-binding protein [Leuconostoc citreum]MCK8605326.1 ABC transporter ATP-binding protein [Leuconostoc citreum]
MTQLLTVNNLSVNYGAIKAVQGVSLSVNRGEIVTLIGANGAGKSTILRTIAGLEKVASGLITFENQGFNRMPSDKRVQNGVVLVPEGRRVFPGMTVQENLQLGAFSVKDKHQVHAAFDTVYEQFPILKARLNQDAATLSGGEQQMLAIGRALMANPKMILLDEPSMGLAPLYIQKIFDIIENIRNRGVTVLVIEQNAAQALRIADRGYVIESGKIIATDTGEALLVSDDVKRAYLGSDVLIK